MKSAYFRYQPAQRVFRIDACTGISATYLDELQNDPPRLGEERELVGLVGARATPLYVPNVQSDPRIGVRDLALRSAYYTPVSNADALLGVAAFFAEQPDAFDKLHRALADAHAGELAKRWWLESVACSATPEHATCGLHDALRALTNGAGGEATASGPSADAKVDLAQLSDRERDVVLAMCRGLRLAEIARVLGISHHTARNHLKRVFKKLGVHSQVELLVILGNGKAHAPA